MRNIILTTESGADLTESLIKHYPIRVVPMHVIMDDIDYRDGHFPVTDIFDYYDKTKKIPSTTSTNPNEYEALFSEIRQEHPDATIVHIGYTSKASSSFQNALIAGEEFENIHFIDALNVTAGLGAVVLYAAKLLEEKPDISLNDFITAIEQTVAKTRLSFLPGQLEYLRAGGRVSNAQYLGAQLFKIKPLIELVDGKLVSTKKYRGKMLRAVNDLLDDYFTRYQLDNSQLYLIYSIGLDDSIKEAVEASLIARGFPHFDWVQAGCVISCHCGPAAFGIAGIEK